MDDFKAASVLFAFGLINSTVLFLKLDAMFITGWREIPFFSLDCGKEQGRKGQCSCRVDCAIVSRMLLYFLFFRFSIDSTIVKHVLI